MYYCVARVTRLVLLIILDLLKPVTIEDPSSEEQQSKIVNRFQELGTYRGRRQFVGPPTRWKIILKRYVLRCLRKEARISQDFNVLMSSFQVSGAEKSRLPRLR